MQPCQGYDGCPNLKCSRAAALGDKRQALHYYEQALPLISQGGNY